MPLTRLQLANRALTKLAVVGTGQSPEAEDTQKANDVIDAMDADLSARNIYSISDFADIDAAAFNWLAEYLAFLIGPDFGIPQDDGQRQRAEYMLHRLNASGPTYEVLRTEYF